ncbi:MAG TPA: sugar phosphate isomerase/epimerase [Anaerolineaceae bacterium]|nr:sugar phosphate isomerase/epimerase [Anaerolineaceae bacterium]
MEIGGISGWENAPEMHLSVATANLYFKPFELALAVIAEAGFDCVELDLYWQRKEWAMAQHLEGVPPKKIAQIIRRFGLKVTSIHDGSGVLEESQTTRGYINPDLDQVLDQLGYAPDCLVFHTPHIEGEQDHGWWQRISPRIVEDLEPYRRLCPSLTIENMPGFPGYTVPLITPQELQAFTSKTTLGVTLDTTHYAQIGVDIIGAASVLRNNVTTIHLSDYSFPRTHVFIGEGELNLPAFFAQLDLTRVNAITLECSLSKADRTDKDMPYGEMVSRLMLAKQKLMKMLQKLPA